MRVASLGSIQRTVVMVTKCLLISANIYLIKTTFVTFNVCSHWRSGQKNSIFLLFFFKKKWLEIKDNKIYKFKKTKKTNAQYAVYCTWKKLLNVLGKKEDKREIEVDLEYIIKGTRISHLPSDGLK